MQLVNARSPTLETVLMVEQQIEKHSGEFTKRELWMSLPRKVMWQTYLVVLGYLESINKIAFDKKEHVAYIWNPKLTARLALRPEASGEKTVASRLRVRVA